MEEQDNKRVEIKSIAVTASTPVILSFVLETFVYMTKRLEQGCTAEEWGAFRANFLQAGIRMGLFEAQAPPDKSNESNNPASDSVSDPVNDSGGVATP